MQKVSGQRGNGTFGSSGLEQPAVNSIIPMAAPDKTFLSNVDLLISSVYQSPCLVNPVRKVGKVTQDKTLVLSPTHFSHLGCHQNLHASGTRHLSDEHRRSLSGSSCVQDGIDLSVYSSTETRLGWVVIRSVFGKLVMCEGTARTTSGQTTFVTCWCAVVTRGDNPVVLDNDSTNFPACAVRSTCGTLGKFPEVLFPCRTIIYHIRGPFVFTPRLPHLIE